jgi:hypothetical protein
MDNGHNLNPCHGKLKNWEKMDIQRLIHTIVIEQYLLVEMISTKDYIQAYIRIGPRVEHLMNNSEKITISLADKKSKNTRKLKVGSSENSAILNVVEKCFYDLVKIVTRIAYEKGCKFECIMDNQVLKVSCEIFKTRHFKIF